MKKNLSTLSIGPGLSVKGMNSPVQTKKVEGIDKRVFGQSFNEKLQKIKNRPKKDSLEDIYIKGLQDQIQCLELQLKLLKEKEIAKHSQVDQLETFFGDGIPINENILALKNGFNSYKTQTDKKIQNLEMQKKQREQLIASIIQKISQASQLIKEQQINYKNELTAQSNLTHEKVKKGVLLKQQAESEEQNLKILKIENRKLTEIMAGMERAKELLLIAILRNDNHKYVKLNKLRELIGEQQGELEKLSQAYQQLKKQDDEKTYVINLQQSNIRLKKKIICLEKELNSLRIKSQQKKIELQAKLKQRHKEINARLDMQKRLDSTKEAICAENNISIEDLEKAAKEGQLKILQSIIDKNKKLTKYVDYYGRLLSKVEENLYDQGQKKPSLKSELQVYQSKVKQLEKVVQSQKLSNCILKSELAEYESFSSHASEIVPSMINEIKRCEDKLKCCKVERERLIEDIKLKEKQLELVEILKSLNLEEIEISSSSNTSIQDRLVDFIRSWETLNRS